MGAVEYMDTPSSAAAALAMSVRARFVCSWLLLLVPRTSSYCIMQFNSLKYLTLSVRVEEGEVRGRAHKPKMIYRMEENALCDCHYHPYCWYASRIRENTGSRICDTGCAGRA
ncbi:hypothetical protein EI94DRAFT_1057773 [Lactarius quietus]|nr:hypothetical protein EI94DRAFT_1057773 [Lactarius quietus]